MVLFWNLSINSQKKFHPSKSTIVEVTAGLAKTTMTALETKRITMQDCIILESYHELPKIFQPSKSTIVEVTAGLAKTTMTTIKTTRITLQDGTILKSFHELPKKISAI